MLFSVILQAGFAQRIIQSINSGWMFSSEQDSGKTELVNFPHTWNNKDALLNGTAYYRGKANYIKTFFIPERWKNKRLYLKFEGANQVVNLYVNGKLAGTHKGGYTGFVFDVSEFVEAGKNNQFRIECDNSYNAAIPPLTADFTFYGGVYRDVYLMVTDPIQFVVNNIATGNLRIITPSVSKAEAEVAISCEIGNYVLVPQKAEVELNVFSPANQKIYSERKGLRLSANHVQNLDFNFKINTPDLWSPEKPQLYRVELTLLNAETGKTVDFVSSDFGCRWFSVDPDNGFFLNGKKYRLMGVSRHQDDAGLGNALPNKIHENDIKTIKAMGSNFIRIAHYPQDPDVYAWCDKLGLLVWSEIPIVNQITNSQAFFNNCLKMQSEHVLQNISHPSVIMWGYMNEIFLRPPFTKSTTGADRNNYIKSTVELAQKLNDETKALDSTRITVMALHQSQLYNTSGLADIPDLVGWNLYMGWYGGEQEQLGEFLDKEHSHHPKRPIMISEYGPGADIRLQTNHPKPWDYSEAYQLQLHASYVNQVFKRPFVIGMAAWNFADFGSAGRVDGIPSVNQKGLLTFDRSTKDIYYYYQARLLRRPFVYLSGKNHSTYYSCENEQGKGEVNLDLFSDCREVHLYVDDLFFRTVFPKNGLAHIVLQLEEGEHEIKAESEGESFIRSVRLKLRCRLLDILELEPLAVNVGSNCDFTADITHETWIADQSYKPGGWGYVGGNVYHKTSGREQGTDQNIMGTADDPLYQTMREGIQNYRFDVKPGVYKVSLLMTDPDQSNADKMAYDLGVKNTEQNVVSREFNVLINGIPVCEHLNIAETFGYNYAVNISFEIRSENGINIQFDAISGKPVLSGIRLEVVSARNFLSEYKLNQLK